MLRGLKMRTALRRWALMLAGTVLGLLAAQSALFATATIYAGSQNIDMHGSKVVNLGTPTAASDAATKSYVDSASGITYRGVTSSAVNGNLGGIAAAHARCQGNYSGSRMCAVTDLVKAGVTTGPANNARVIDDVGRAMHSVYSSTLYYQLNGGDGRSAIEGTSSTILMKNCAGFTTSSNSYYTTYWESSSGGFFLTTCGSSYRIACCEG